MKTWLIVCQNLYCFALLMKNVADHCVFHSVILLKRSIQCQLTATCCTFHQLGNISTADCNRQKTYSSQNGETASYIIRYYKSLIAFLVSYVFQSSSCFISGCIDSLCSLGFAVFLLQHFLKYAECDRRLRCSSGFGDHIDGKITITDHIHQIFDIAGGKAVSYKIDLRSLTNFFGYTVVEAVS